MSPVSARVVVTVSLLLVTGDTFNLAPRNSSVFRDPLGQDGSYFGMSVELQRNNEDDDYSPSFRLLVGAPKANVSSNSKIDEPGTVYQCHLTGSMPCTSLTLENKGNSENITFYIAGFKNPIIVLTRHSWTGGVIAVKHQPSDGILMCAPRAKMMYGSVFLINGFLYLKEYTRDSIKSTTNYLPLFNKTLQLVRKNDTSSGKFFYAHGQAGFSAHYTQDDSELLIGSPGVRDGAGTVIKYKNFGFSNEDITIPNPGNITQLKAHSYFGYAVSSGKFFSTSTRISYVAGAPRAGYVTGKVLVFQYVGNSEQLDILCELEGTQVGEYFGASICAVDLNGDQLDDLVVGAPHYSQDTHDEGRVYVFINEDMGVFREIGDKNKVVGTQTNSQFGTTVASIGDLNLDGYNDIAVGAPYEDSGRGAVYIYHGSNTGLNVKYSQRIRAAEIHTSLSGFGISISRGLDIDNNSYNDVAVGAFSSGHAVLIPSQPVISVRMRLTSDITTVGINASGFIAVACLSYTGKQAPATTGLLITLQVSPTSKDALLPSMPGTGNGSYIYQYYRLLNNNKENCHSISVELVKGKIRDYTKPIELLLRYELDYRHQLFVSATRDVIFCKKCPVVDPRHKATTSLTIPYALECGADDVCRSDLSLQVEWVGARSEFILGAQSKVILKVVVSNRGEPAFFVKVNGILPQDTPLSRLPSVCEEVSDSEEAQHTLLDCDMGNFLGAGAQRSFLLEFDLSELRPKTRSVEYFFNVTGVGVENNLENNIRSLSLPIQISSDISILGHSSQDQGQSIKKNQVSYHTYEVRNYGPSPADILRLEFYIPVIASGLRGDSTLVKVFKPMAYFDNQPITCTPRAGRTFSVEDEVKEVIEEDNAEEPEPSLSKRSVETQQKPANIWFDLASHSEIDHLPYNRTLFINCSSAGFECLSVVCDAGPFKTTQNRATVSFRLVTDFEKIGSFIGKKDIVVMSSHGTVKILNLSHATQPLDGRPDEYSINSIFFGNRKEEPIDSWLLALSISVGILILLMVIGALTKVGFFVRTKRAAVSDLNEEYKGGLMVDTENESENDLQDVTLESPED